MFQELQFLVGQHKDKWSQYTGFHRKIRLMHNEGQSGQEEVGVMRFWSDDGIR